jgi:hypothetical protein
MLEPCDGKLSRTVLRGERGRKASALPGVGAEAIVDDGIPFEEKMAELSDTLYEQMRESIELDAVIRKNLEVLGYGE